MSSTPLEEHYRPVDAVAGILASMSIFASLTSIVWHPLRLVIASVLLALIASAMTTRYRLLAGVAVAVGGLAWMLGMTIAVITGNPLW